MKKVIAIVVIIIIGLVIYQSKEKTHLTVGVISTLSGNAAYVGESTMKGAEIGKIKARKENNISIEMIHEDSLFTPKGGIDAYNKLRESDKINALITQASNVSVAVAPLAIKDNIIDIAVSTLATAYSTPDDMTFRMTTKADVEAGPALEYLKSKNARRLGILYMNNEIGVSLRDSLKKLSNTVVIEEGFDPAGQDFKTQLLKMKQAGIDSLYLASLASHSAIILKQADEIKLNVIYVSYRASEDPTLLKNAGTLAERLVYTNAYDTNNQSSENKEFVSLYQEKYNELPNGYAAEAYEATRLIANTYSQCKLDIECSKSYLFSVKNRPSLFGPLSFDNNGDVMYSFFLKTVRNGQFVKLEK